MRVLILGVNGFIGNALTERILNTTDWEVSGLDIAKTDDREKLSLGLKAMRMLGRRVAKVAEKRPRQ